MFSKHKKEIEFSLNLSEFKNIFEPEFKDSLLPPQVKPQKSYRSKNHLNKRIKYEQNLENGKNKKIT